MARTVFRIRVSNPSSSSSVQQMLIYVVQIGASADPLDYLIINFDSLVGLEKGIDDTRRTWMSCVTATNRNVHGTNSDTETEKQCGFWIFLQIPRCASLDQGRLPSTCVRCLSGAAYKPILVRPFSHASLALVKPVLDPGSSPRAWIVDQVFLFSLCQVIRQRSFDLAHRLFNLCLCLHDQYRRGLEA